MVQMPVRVKPPPAEMGETISPGWAALTVTTPSKGAVTMVSATLRRATSSPARADPTWRWASWTLAWAVS